PLAVFEHCPVANGACRDIDELTGIRSGGGARLAEIHRGAEGARLDRGAKHRIFDPLNRGTCGAVSTARRRIGRAAPRRHCRRNHAGGRGPREQTDTIPIVMRGVADPIASGFVASLARPGGNITGPSSQASDIQEKSLQLLKEVRPEMVRVALLWTPENADSRRDREKIEAVAPKLGITVETVPIPHAEDTAHALAGIAQNRPDALLTHATAVLQVNNKATIAFALAQRLPTFASPFTQMAREGLLLGYGPDLPAENRVAAGYVDRILRDAKPAELPVEQPTKFELVINLRTARAIGLEIPPSLLARADEVIE